MSYQDMFVNNNKIFGLLKSVNAYYFIRENETLDLTIILKQYEIEKLFTIVIFIKICSSRYGYMQ